MRPGYRRWLVALAILFALTAAWSLATPLMAAPDEPAQVIKAAAVARGEFLGDPLPRTSHGPNPTVRVQVPQALASTTGAFQCFEFRPYTPASCAPPIRGSAKLVSAETYAGRYPPLYYAVVGLPSLAFPSSAGIRLMRLLSALLCCIFLAAALESAARWGRSRLGVLAVAVATTPMVFFLAGVVNPNSLEIASGICLWASGLALLRTEEKPSRGQMAWAAISASVMVEMRGISPLWLLVILLALVAVAERSRLRLLAADRTAWVWASMVVASTCFSLWWLTRYDSLTVLSGVSEPRASLANLVEKGLGRSPTLAKEMVGLVGWLDTPAPAVTYFLWGALVAVLLAAGLSFGSARRSTVLALTALAAVAIPIALDVHVAPTLGFVWQGRYGLPLAAGVPILSVHAISSRWRLSAVIGRRPVALGIGALFVAQGAMFLLALRRYTVGLKGPLDPFSGKWQPPFGAIGVTALFVVSLLAYWVWLASIGNSRDTTGSSHEEVGGDVRARVLDGVHGWQVRRKRQVGFAQKSSIPTSLGTRGNVPASAT